MNDITIVGRKAGLPDVDLTSADIDNIDAMLKAMQQENERTGEYDSIATRDFNADESQTIDDRIKQLSDRAHTALDQIEKTLMLNRQVDTLFSREQAGEVIRQLREMSLSIDKSITKVNDIRAQHERNRTTGVDPGARITTETTV